MRSSRKREVGKKDKRALKQQGVVYAAPEETRYVERRVAKPLRPLNQAQHEYLTSIKNNTITFGVGPAGVGKTYIAAAYAAELFQAGDIETLVVTRPNIEAGESLGFLPGELEEKFAPYMEPFIDVLEERLGKTFVAYLIKRGSIQQKPLGFMRGKSFNRCLCILDEAQNTTPKQMQMFLTRLGDETSAIVNGDLAQQDIHGVSGLRDAANVLRQVNSIGIAYFTREDSVRGAGLTRDILEAYDRCGN